MRLAGKAGIVTGAGRGLGRAYAEALAAEGASVLVNDLDPDAVDEVVAAITTAGGTAAPLVAAVGTEEVGQQLVTSAVATFGRLDFVVTNAGMLRDSSVLKMSEADFEAVVKTHLVGTFACAKAAMARFREQGEGGSLVLVGSPAGQQASFGQANYSAAKAGIAGMGRTLALEGKKAGISVNVLVPVALTRMTATIPGLADVARDVENGQPVPATLRQAGFGLPQDVAPMVVFLVSDKARHVTGQVFGAGGDRISIWSQPSEVEVATRDGGWDAEAIERAFPERFEPVLQNYLPPAPPAPDRGAA